MANRPKGKLFALLAVFAAIGLVAASGAFSTVTAERTADVSVAGDSAALLGLEGIDDDYTSVSGGEFQIELTNANLDALTEIEPLFNLTNRGSNDVEIWIEKEGGNATAVNFFNTSGSNSIVGTNTGSNLNITSSTNKVTLGSGNSMNVSMEIDTRGMTLSGGDELLSNITIHANSTS